MMERCTVTLKKEKNPETHFFVLFFVVLFSVRPYLTYHQENQNYDSNDDENVRIRLLHNFVL